MGSCTTEGATDVTRRKSLNGSSACSIYYCIMVALARLIVRRYIQSETCTVIMSALELRPVFIALTKLPNG